MAIGGSNIDLKDIFEKERLILGNNTDMFIALGKVFVNIEYLVPDFQNLIGNIYHSSFIFLLASY